MTQPVYDLSNWADIVRVCAEPDYAKSKHLTVKKQGDLFVIRYEKEHLIASRLEEGMGLFRSVIADGQQVVCFSPPKVKEFPDALIDMPIYDQDRDDGTKGQAPVWCEPHVVGHSEEFVEGTMVNLFWDPGAGDWELTTRSCVGARNKFYEDQDKTFRYMFLEAMNGTALEFTDLQKELCYSFVLQHPENRLVIPFMVPSLVLVAVYRPMGTRIEVIDKESVLQTAFENSSPDSLRYPASTRRTLFQDHDPSDGQNPGWFVSFAWMKDHFDQGREGYQVMGVVIHYGDGNRARIRNKNYEYVRRLRGNNTRMQFHYYSLRSAGKVGEFLRYYPEWKEAFGDMRDDLHSWTNSLRENYMSCFARKERRLHQYPFAFRPHMRSLHQIYHDTLRPDRKYVTSAVARDYVNDLPPARLMFAINYEINRRHTDEKVVETQAALEATQTLPSSH